MKFQLMVTCLGDVLRPQAGMATVRLLRRLGHDVDFPKAQTCCGQPFFNSGYADLVRQQARHTIETFAKSDAVVVPSGSCAAMIKAEYPLLFEGDSVWLGRAQELAARTFELTDLLVNRLAMVDVGARFDGRVTYHYACHLRGLNLRGEAEKLIEHVQGATLVPLRHAEQCCGFGGSFSVRYPKISTAMVSQKAQCVIETDADVAVSTDTGCLMNLGGRLRRLGATVRTMHLAELLAGDETAR